MEPDDLNSLSPDDAKLEAWLRANASLPRLPDDGFSCRVLAALPPVSRKARVSERRRVVLCGAAVGVIVAVALYFAGTPGDFVWPTAGPAAGDLVAQFADPKPANLII